MQLPTDRKYASTHEWVQVEGDVVLVGITDFAQDQLGDLVFVGDFTTQVHLDAGAVAGIVESVKAASDIYAPIAGTVVEYNQSLDDVPEQLNEAPFSTWIFKLKPDNLADMESLLTAEQYQAENN
ncbi:glycine cleavage system protein GcvH [Paenalcaligenes hominis]|uniref:glycine cleavage system protein GcvH n=1 Tax=Paenalcaligenes hominis TaxID=643674 RepID=UPI00352608C6